MSESARIQQNRTKTVRLRHRMDQPAVSVSLREQPTTRGVRDVLQEMSRFQREVSPLGRALGLFCKRSGIFKGIPSLCKCYNACKVLYPCESGGIAVKTGPIRGVPVTVPGARTSTDGPPAAASASTKGTSEPGRNIGAG